MTEIRNEFSWSKSRDEVFMTCPRQYYFNYYGYWGGWKTTAPQRTWQIYLLQHEYEAGIEDSEWKRVAENVTQCLRNFYGSGLFSELRDLPPENWLEIE